MIEREPEVAVSSVLMSAIAHLGIDLRQLLDPLHEAFWLDGGDVPRRFRTRDIEPPTGAGNNLSGERKVPMPAALPYIAGTISSRWLSISALHVAQGVAWYANGGEGMLFVRRGVPRTLRQAMGGSLLEEVIDHPMLRGCGVRIVRAHGDDETTTITTDNPMTTLTDDGTDRKAHAARLRRSCLGMLAA